MDKGLRETLAHLEKPDQLELLVTLENLDQEGRGEKEAKEGILESSGLKEKLVPKALPDVKVLLDHKALVARKERKVIPA